MILNPLQKNNVTVVDEGNSFKTMIFTHGFGTDQSAWAHVYPEFADNYKIVLYDNVGAGNSDMTAYSPNKYDNLNSYADDLLDICSALNITDAIFVGHSVGGMISLLASIKEPGRFKKMVLIGASARYQNDIDYIGGFDSAALDNLFMAMANNYYAWVSGFAPAAMANSDKPELAESFAQSLSALRPDIAQEVAKVIFRSDYRDALPLCKTETLLLQTRQDIAVPMEAAQYLQEHIENSELRVIEAEGHFPHMSAPAEVVREIKNFI